MESLRRSDHMDLDIERNEEKGNFHVVHEGKVSVLDYEQVDEKTLDFKSTYVPEDQRDKGIGGQIVRHALEYAEERGYRVVPSCPFVKSYIEEHPRFQQITTSA
jgi:predicted GNAT family acetyltransferase